MYTNPLCELRRRLCTIVMYRGMYVHSIDNTISRAHNPKKELNKVPLDRWKFNSKRAIGTHQHIHMHELLGSG